MKERVGMTLAFVGMACITAFMVMTCVSISESDDTQSLLAPIEFKDSPVECLTVYAMTEVDGSRLYRVCDRSNGTMLYSWRGETQAVPMGCRSRAACMEMVK